MPSTGDDGLDFEELRRHLLRVVISEFSGGTVPPEAVLAPTCPLCGEGPAMVPPAGTQAFCGNDDCDVLMWNPTLGPEQVHTGSRLQAETDEQGRITWRPEEEK